MKRNHFITAIILTISLFLVLQSCEKKEIVNTENVPIEKQIKDINKVANLSDIEFVEGMLVFESMEEYEAIIDNEGRITTEDLIAWEKEIGFTSQQSILEQALIEEDKYFDQYDPTTMTEEEIAKVIKEKEALGYTDFTKKYIDLGIIKPYTYEDISSFELTVESKIYPAFLNLDGMVKIGNIIYQYTSTQCKQLIDGDFNKIDLLKKTINRNDNIKIGNLVADKASWHGYLTNPALKAKTNGHYRIYAGIKLRIYDYGSERDFYYYLQYLNYKEKWRFGWKWKQDRKADTNVNGKVKVTVQGESGSYFYVSYSHTNLWSDHIPVTNALPMVPAGKTVTFSNAGFTFKRNNVASLYRYHYTKIK